MEKYILFVCTGNTCRSPMAEALFNKYSEEKKLSITARSCGLAASDGGEVSYGAVEAMEAYGIDISDHRAVKITDELVRNAYMVICMTKYQAECLMGLYDDEPDIKAKITAVDPEIPDPYGGDSSDYRRTAGMLDELLSKLAEL